MAKITYKTGDLLTAEEAVLIHGCNSHGVMGSGVALFLRQKYPKAYEDYHAQYKARGLPLGSIVWSQQTTHEQHMIANAITQKDAGSQPNHRYASYDAIARVFESIDMESEDDGYVVEAWRRKLGNVWPADFKPSVALPLIGAGLAQGRWPIIASIIETHSTNYQPVVYLLDGKIPT